ncbi:GNAT family N-acetyltransferase [Vibrio genomosp. F6]|uniref:acyl-homoserine-lactone synthase n=1 Tax=Vibrio TaxID=662 RepID=UPI0010BE1834|nr:MULTISPECIES: acyl-homoserine-lactone synthase [Vibrio]MDN3697123.1 acyl-homoserine-lactone synthase [Vibrio cortegadensis]TKF21686.1 GNAT family N-acetyltransferase [Vibrio genomosp. F6]
MTIQIHSHNLNAIPKHDYINLLKLRYKVFSARLHWDLETSEEMETDQYDVELAHYLYAMEDEGSMVGCWRILPTTTDYMLKNTFPELLGGISAPVDEKVYELSRFAVDKDFSRKVGGVSNITLKMFQSLYYHAQDKQIDSYVTVTSAGVEKLIKRMGIPCSRIGDQKVHMLGDTKSVALHIPMNNHYRESVGA